MLPKINVSPLQTPVNKALYAVMNNYCARKYDANAELTSAFSQEVKQGMLETTAKVKRFAQVCIDSSLDTLRSYDI